MSRKPLETGSLDDFTPTPKRTAPAKSPPQKESKPAATAGPPLDAWSRREAPQEAQFTIRARMEVIDRFKKRCRPPRGGRYTYGEMLEILLDETEEKG